MTNPATSPAPRLTEYVGGHRYDPEFNARYDRGLEAAQVPEVEWRRARFYNMANLLRATAGLPGITAEAGCHRGQSSHLICETRALDEPAFDGATHIIIDSFEGLSEPGHKDGDFAVTRHADGAFTDTSVDHVAAALSAFPAVTLHKGWIPQVLDQVPEAQYRFVHIDVDLYEPALACLEYFYPRLVPSGIIVVDDFGPVPMGSYPGCKQACDEFAAAHNLHFAPLTVGNACLIRHAR